MAEKFENIVAKVNGQNLPAVTAASLLIAFISSNPASEFAGENRAIAAESILKIAAAFAKKYGNDAVVTVTGETTEDKRGLVVKTRTLKAGNLGVLAQAVKDACSAYARMSELTSLSVEVENPSEGKRGRPARQAIGIQELEF